MTTSRLHRADLRRDKNIRQMRTIVDAEPKLFPRYPAWLTLGDDAYGTIYGGHAYHLSLVEGIDDNFLDLHQFVADHVRRLHREELPRDLVRARVVITQTKARLPELLVELTL